MNISIQPINSYAPENSENQSSENSMDKEPKIEHMKDNFFLANDISNQSDLETNIKIEDLWMELTADSENISLESLSELKELTLYNYWDLRKINRFPDSLKQIVLYGFDSPEEADKFLQEVAFTMPKIREKWIKIIEFKTIKVHKTEATNKNETIKEPSFWSGLWKKWDSFTTKAKKAITPDICQEYEKWKNTNDKNTKDNVMNFISYKISEKIKDKFL